MIAYCGRPPIGLATAIICQAGSLSAPGFRAITLLRMNRIAHSYRFTYFYWPDTSGGRRAARG